MQFKRSYKEDISKYKKTLEVSNEILFKNISLTIEGKTSPVGCYNHTYQDRFIYIFDNIDTDNNTDNSTNPFMNSYESPDILTYKYILHTIKLKKQSVFFYGVTDMITQALKLENWYCSDIKYSKYNIERYGHVLPTKYNIISSNLTDNILDIDSLRTIINKVNFVLPNLNLYIIDIRVKETWHLYFYIIIGLYLVNKNGYSVIRLPNNLINEPVIINILTLIRSMYEYVHIFKAPWTHVRTHTCVYPYIKNYLIFGNRYTGANMNPNKYISYIHFLDSLKKNTKINYYEGDQLRFDYTIDTFNDLKYVENERSEILEKINKLLN